MRSRTRRILTPLLLSTALLSTGCAQRASHPSILLTEGDRAHAADPARPTVGPLTPPAATGAAERTYLLAAVIRPILAFSIAQEAATAAERQRADGVVAKVDRFASDTAPPKRKKFLGLF